MTTQRIFVAATIMGLGLVPLWADFTQEEKTEITGGAMLKVLKIAGRFGAGAAKPTQTTTYVQGDRMATHTENTAHIIDVASETITDIDFKKKEYSVLTFAEMAQAMAKLKEKLEGASAGDPAKGEQKGEVKINVSAKDAGETRQIAGVQARKMILTMEIEGKDAKSGQTGTMKTTADVWLAPAVPGHKERREFQMKMAKKLAAEMPSGFSFIGATNPQAGEGLKLAMKEIEKMEGTPVLQIMRVGAEGTGQNAAPQAPPPQEQPSASAPQPPASVGGALGAALGGFGGFGRRKKPAEQPPPPQPSSQPAPSGQAPPSGALLETTTETISFSTAPIDPAKFAVPAGFKQVEHAMKEMLKK